MKLDSEQSHPLTLDSYQVAAGASKELLISRVNEGQHHIISSKSSNILGACLVPWGEKQGEGRGSRMEREKTHGQGPQEI